MNRLAYVLPFPGQSLLCTLMLPVPLTRDNSLHSSNDDDDAQIPMAQVPAQPIYTKAEATVNKESGEKEHERTENLKAGEEVEIRRGMLRYGGHSDVGLTARAGTFCEHF